MIQFDFWISCGNLTEIHMIRIFETSSVCNCTVPSNGMQVRMHFLSLHLGDLSKILCSCKRVCVCENLKSSKAPPRSAKIICSDFNVCLCSDSSTDMGNNTHTNSSRESIKMALKSRKKRQSNQAIEWTAKIKKKPTFAI